MERERRRGYKTTSLRNERTKDLVRGNGSLCEGRDGRKQDCGPLGEEDLLGWHKGAWMADSRVVTSLVKAIVLKECKLH